MNEKISEEQILELTYRLMKARVALENAYMTVPDPWHKEKLAEMAHDLIQIESDFRGLNL